MAQPERTPITLELKRSRPAVLRGYRRLLVPLVSNPESQRAIDLACRLASEHGASIVATTVIEVPPLLPLDADMTDEEAEARVLLDRASATADTYGVKMTPRLLRARTAGGAIVELVRENDIELVVVGSARAASRNTPHLGLGATVEHVLRHAGCRVLVIGARRTD